MTAPVLSYRPGDGAGVRADLDRLVASRMLVQANSGGGKSRAIRQLLEETYGSVQQIVLDPEGEFSTLRERFDYVLAGKEGDVPATPKSAKLLCRRLVELSTSAVIDLYDLPMYERREFVRLFLVELMALPRALWHPILVVIDEAHLFAPERGSGESVSTDAVIALCTQGRKRGFCAVLATQRISKLHKDAAAELLNKLIGRTGLDVDQKRAGDELGLDKDGRRALAHLAPGEFYAYGPAIASVIQLVRTGDVVTTHPEAGRLGAAPPPPSSKVKALLAHQLADLPKEAEEEARTIADLTRQLRDATARATRAEKQSGPRVVEKPVADDRAIARAVAAATRPLQERHASLVKEFRRTVRTFGSVAGEFSTASEQLRDVLARAEATIVAEESGQAPTPSPERPYRPSPPMVPPYRSERAVAPAMRTVDGVTGVEQRILNTLAGLSALGVDAPDKATAAALVGYHPNAKSYANALGSLRTAGRVEYPSGGRIALTDSGRAIAENSLPVSSRAELHRLWFERLGNVAERILAPLLEAYPDAIHAADVAEVAGYHPNAKSFANTKGRLRTLGLIDYPASGMIVATGVLFPKGLR